MKTDELAALFLNPFRKNDRSKISRPFLSKDQSTSVEALEGIISRYGGALLASTVGSGKTRVALTTAREICSSIFQPKIIVISPARLHTHWKTENKKTENLTLLFITHTQLSRHSIVLEDVDFFIIDEAHRFRNPKAKRSIALRKILEKAPCLLLSGTPFINHFNDLLILIRYFADDSDIRYFLGIDPQNISIEDLILLMSTFSIRRKPHTGPKLVVKELLYTLPPNELDFWETFVRKIHHLKLDILQKEWPIGLIRFHLIQQLRKGYPALLSSLISIKNYCEVWQETEHRNLGMNRSFFKKNFSKGQQSLSFMYPEKNENQHYKSTQDLKIITQLITTLSLQPHSAIENIIFDTVKKFSKIILFCSSVNVAHRYFQYFQKQQLRTGLITGRNAQLSGIGISTAENILLHFQSSHANSIQVLIATDCISEGFSFPNCGHLILCDIPDSAYKLEQRVGRIVRRNSAFDTVHVLVPRPQNWNKTIGLLSRYAIEKAIHSNRLGFGYPLANQVFDLKSPQENPFNFSFEIDQLIAQLPKQCSQKLTSIFFTTQKLKTDLLDTITLIAVFNDNQLFEYRWSSTINNHHHGIWRDIRKSLEGLIHNKRETYESPLPFPDIEKIHFDQMIENRNSVRLAPHPSLETKIATSIFLRMSRFSINTVERNYIKSILFQTPSRGHRFFLENLHKQPDSIILRTLFQKKSPSRISKLHYKIVLHLKFVH